MKKFLFISVICLAYSIASLAQMDTSKRVPLTSAELYIQKSKKQKTTAWIMLGGGASFILLGDLIGNRKNSTFDDAGTGFVLAGAGALSMLGSIPLFIASARNKRKSKNTTVFLLKIESVPVIQQGSLIRQSYPALSVNIKLK